MEAASNAQARPDVSAQERNSNELVKRIRKLRWIGLDDEAEHLKVLLRHIRLIECIDS